MYSISARLITNFMPSMRPVAPLVSPSGALPPGRGSSLHHQWLTGWFISALTITSSTPLDSHHRLVGPEGLWLVPAHANTAGSGCLNRCLRSEAICSTKESATRYLYDTLKAH